MSKKDQAQPQVLEKIRVSATASGGYKYNYQPVSNATNSISVTSSEPKDAAPKQGAKR